jgi:trehalose synthase
MTHGAAIEGWPAPNGAMDLIGEIHGQSVHVELSEVARHAWVRAERPNFRPQRSTVNGQRSTGPATLPPVRCHLQPLPLGRRAAGDYAEFAGEERIERLRQTAKPLRGVRVLHLAAAGTRLRSPEIVPSLLSLYEDLGLHAEYQVLAGDRPLWRVVRQLEDGLQGGETAISDDTWSEFMDDSPAPQGYDAIVAHGPGPLPAAAKAGVPYLWRCELGHDNPDPSAWDRVKPLIDGAQGGAELPEAIDPLSPASVDLPTKLAGSMLRSLGVDLTQPCCFQARPFDTWQDPHDVLDVFAIARERAPGLQLVLAGDPGHEDVEGWRLLREVSDYAEARDGLLLLRGVGDVELNALRALARAGVESSLAPGSELTTLETQWKRTPVVSAGDAGAPEAAAEQLVELVNDPGLAIELGEAGHERVRAHHLITTLAESELRLLASFQSA